MYSMQIRLSGALLAAILAGCAAPVSTNITVSPAHVAKYNDLSDLKVVATLEKSVEEARSTNMPFLAPHYFREAAQVLSECQSALGNKPKEVLVSNAAKGEAILEKGRAVMSIVQYRFAKELELKAQLDAHEAAKLLPKDYEKVIGDLSRLIEIVEREQAFNIDKEKDAVQKAMLDLVIKAVQEGALHESEAINAESKKKNADKQAPATYAEALRVYQDAKSRIAAAHHDQALVQRLGAEALFAARHAQQVNDRVVLLQKQLNVSAGGGASMSLAAGSVTGAQVAVQADGKPAVAEKLTLERLVLQEEDRLLAISAALGLKDLRDQPLDKQVEELKRVAGEIAHQSGKAAAQDLEARLKAANEATQQAVAKLEAQTAQLADKEAQIKTLRDKVTQLERAQKPRAKSRAAAPKKK